MSSNLPWGWKIKICQIHVIQEKKKKSRNDGAQETDVPDCKLASGKTRASMCTTHSCNFWVPIRGILQIRQRAFNAKKDDWDILWRQI